MVTCVLIVTLFAESCMIIFRADKLDVVTVSAHMKDSWSEINIKMSLVRRRSMLSSTRHRMLLNMNPLPGDIRRSVQRSTRGDCNCTSTCFVR